MKKTLVPVILILLVGCGGSSKSYKAGQEMADKTYGSMAPEKMVAEANTILKQVKAELDKAENKREWWDGFCDRGEQIWLERIEKINEGMGQQVLDPDKIKSMFNQMRTKFEE